MEMECSAEEMDVLQRELAESSASAQLTGAIVGQCTAATGSSGTHEDEDFDIWMRLLLLIMVSIPSREELWHCQE